MTGTTWIEEAGSFNLPIVLSNTHAVGACHTGVVSWVNRVDPRLARQWLLPVCAETWDGYLNDINGGHVRAEHVESALDAATTGPGAGSVIAIVATDAPLLPGQCKALARRVPLGLARTGTTGSHFSGDIFLAFSTADLPGLASAFPVGPAGDDEFGTITFIPWGRMDDLYTAVVQEAVLNALVVNDDMTGRDGHRSPRLPHDRLVALLGGET